MYVSHFTANNSKKIAGSVAKIVNRKIIILIVNLSPDFNNRKKISL